MDGKFKIEKETFPLFFWFGTVPLEVYVWLVPDIPSINKK